MDNCYICLEKTSIYFLSKECDCKIYCHEECLKHLIEFEKCIICKKNINNFSNKIEEETEKIFILRILKKLHDNKLINNILKMESCFDLLFFVIYSIIISLLTIFLSIFILIIYYGYYTYYYYKYKNNNYNFVKLKIK
jgi:hypothetical protein